MEIVINCWDDAGYGEQYSFSCILPKNTKRAKLSFHPSVDTKQLIVDEIEFYEDKSCT